MRFSSRYLAGKGKQALVFEDAPKPFRIGFIKGVMSEFIGAQGSFYGGVNAPLDVLATHEAFIALIRDEAEPWDYDDQNAWQALSSHLKKCTWLEFYDFVELVGKLLLKHEKNEPFGESGYFKAYQGKLNALLQEDFIGWMLNEKSELIRKIPQVLARRTKDVDGRLVDGFSTARQHYQKAVNYLYRHPIDEANSIKEVISALESVARVIEPKAATLGDAIKLMRKRGPYSIHLLDALERLYVFSNATPMVRHGHTEMPKPLLAEAELSLHIGVAFLRYLIEIHETEVPTVAS